MAALVGVFFIFAVLLHVEVHCKVVSMKVAVTAGFTKIGTENSNSFGLQFRLERYKRGNDCIKVMMMEQKQPLRKLGEITITCAKQFWSVTNNLVNYGNTVHIQVDRNKAVWAVFDLGGSCIQHVYKDKGVYELGKEEMTLNREECDQVLRTQQPKKVTQSSQPHGFEDHENENDVSDEGEWGEEETEDEGKGEEEEENGNEGGDYVGGWEDEEQHRSYVNPTKPAKDPRNEPIEISSPEEDYQLINKKKVAVFGSNVAGYKKQESAKTIDGSSYQFTVQKYVKPGTQECFKMVTVRKDNEEKDNVKISCEYETPDKKRGMNLHFEGVIYESLPFSVIYVIKDGLCLNKNYFKFAPIKQQILEENECEKLTGRSKKDRMSGVIPGTEPTSAEDYAVMKKQKVAVFGRNVVGYQKQGNAKTIEGSSYTFIVQKYVKPGTQECFKMVTVRKGDEVKDNVKISCEYETPDRKRGMNLHFEGVIYESLPFNVIYVIKDGFCLSKNYFEFAPIKQQILEENECEQLTGRAKKERISGVIPGTEPISAEDFAVMKKQKVAVLKGSVKGFTPQKQTKYNTLSFKLEVQDFVKGSQCVKVVSLKKDDHDQYFEQVKLPCEVTAPVITDDEDIEMNFGNLVYIQNGVSVVYVIKNGDCLERTYYVSMDQVQYNQWTLSLPECYVLTRWRRDQRSSSEKLNKQPPPKTKEAPGLMWMLSLNGNIESGFTASTGRNQFSGGTFSLEFRDFVKQERCVRKATLKIQNVVADKFLVSCGPYKNMNMIGDQIQYGKAFLIVPGPSPNTYVARFNLREKSCSKKTYTVNEGNPEEISKSQAGPTNDQECKGLIQGTLQLNMWGSSSGGSSIIMSNGNIGSIGSVGNSFVIGNGMTFTSVGSNGNIYI